MNHHSIFILDAQAALSNSQHVKVWEESEQMSRQCRANGLQISDLRLTSEINAVG
jgi:hypothetical protein